MKLASPAAQADLAQLLDHNTFTCTLLYELYALFSSVGKINPGEIREAIVVVNRLYKNSYEMRCKVGKQTGNIQRPSIALTSENIEERLFGGINTFRAHYTGRDLDNLRRPLGSFVNTRCTFR